MLADEVGGRLLQRREVERTVAERPVRREVRRQDIRLVDLIAILLAGRGKSKSSFTYDDLRMRIASGSCALSALTTFAGGIGLVRWKCPTKPSACTPASVRELP